MGRKRLPLVVLVCIAGALSLAAAEQFEFVQQLQLPQEVSGANPEVAALYGRLAVVLTTPDPTRDPHTRSVHIFERGLNARGLWGLRTTIRVPASIAVPGFGPAADLHGDTLVVSAIQHDPFAVPPRGRVFVFERDAGGPGLWGFVAELTAAERSRERFAAGVAVDGDTIAVTSLGAVSLFERHAGGENQWGQVETITAPPTLDAPLDLDGDRLVVSAPTAKSEPHFPGYPVVDNAGAVYVFERPAGARGPWRYAADIPNPDPTWPHFFGDSFEKSSTRFGAALATAEDALAVGWPSYQSLYNDIGNVEILERDSDGQWAFKSDLLVDIEPDEFDQVGESVGISGDFAVAGNSWGTWPVVSTAPDALDLRTIAEATGEVRILYRDARAGRIPWGQTQRIFSPLLRPNDHFGRTLALAGDTLIVAAPGADSATEPEAGAVYVYERPCIEPFFAEYTVGHRAQTIDFDVVSSPDCAWEATSGALWARIVTGEQGTGDGRLLLQLDANTASGASQREALLRIGGRVVRLVQLPGAQIFADAPTGRFYFHAVNRLYELGITAGCGAQPRRFCPNRPLLRSELAAFIVRALLKGVSPHPPNGFLFNDVPADHWAAAYIEQFLLWNYGSGCSDDDYCPEAPVTREQAAEFLIRFRYGPLEPVTLLDPVTFHDVNPDSVYRPWIEKLGETQITNGCAQGMYCPGRAITRGEFALMLLRAGFNELLPDGYPKLTGYVLGEESRASATIGVFGQNTQFEMRVSALSGGQGIETEVATAGIAVVEGPELYADSVSWASAWTGFPYRSLVIRTGTEEAVLPNGFAIPGLD